jgi:hypothetical protein
MKPNAPPRSTPLKAHNKPVVAIDTGHHAMAGGVVMFAEWFQQEIMA